MLTLPHCIRPHNIYLFGKPIVLNAETSGNLRSIALVICCALEDLDATMAERSSWLLNMLFLFKISLESAINFTDDLTCYDMITFKVNQLERYIAAVTAKSPFLTPRSANELATSTSISINAASTSPASSSTPSSSSPSKQGPIPMYPCEARQRCLRRAASLAPQSTLDLVCRRIFIPIFT